MIEAVLVAIIVILAVGFALAAASVRVLREYERAVVFRLGRMIDTKGPGLVLLVPAIDRMVRVSLRTVTLNVPPQDVITRDNVTARVDAVVYFRVVDPNAAVVQVESFLKATSQIAQTTLRSVLGKADLDTLLSEREQLNEELQKIIDEQTEPWGVKVSTVEIKDVGIPAAMQHAMARQAQAERERRAKVINAEGEFQAAARLSEAADVISQNPTTLQLRYLQTLSEIGVNQNSTIVFPLRPDQAAAGGAHGVASVEHAPSCRPATAHRRSSPPAVRAPRRRFVGPGLTAPSAISSAVRNGSTRISGQAAVRPTRGAGAQRRPRHHRRGGRRGGRRDRLSLRRQGAGADRRPREGRRHQGREEPRRGRGALQGHPRDGHQGPHGPRGLDRGRVGHRVRVLRVDRLRPLRQAPAGDALDPGRHGHRGGRRARSRPRSPACTWTRCSASRTSTPAGSRSRPASTPTSCARSARCWPSSTTPSSKRRRCSSRSTR